MVRYGIPHAPRRVVCLTSLPSIMRAGKPQTSEKRYDSVTLRRPFVFGNRSRKHLRQGTQRQFRANCNRTAWRRCRCLEHQPILLGRTAEHRFERTSDGVLQSETSRSTPRPTQRNEYLANNRGNPLHRRRLTNTIDPAAIVRQGNPEPRTPTRPQSCHWQQHTANNPHS